MSSEDSLASITPPINIKSKASPNSPPSSISGIPHSFYHEKKKNLKNSNPELRKNIESPKDSNSFSLGAHESKAQSGKPIKCEPLKRVIGFKV